MRSLRSVATALSVLVGIAAAQDVKCAEGVHIIAARGSYEAQGIGILGEVVNKTLDRIPNSDAVALVYPASINFPIYTVSEPQGVGNLTEDIQKYVDACPDGKLVLFGYSQGAHVIGDVLLGNVNPEFGERDPIDPKYTKNLVAAILMGDPTYIVDQPVNVGTATVNGSFPRKNSDWVKDGYADKVQSYCDEGDFFCASGSGDDALDIHVGYVPEYGDKAVDFVVSQFEEQDACPAGSENNASASPTGTAGGGAPAPTGAAVQLKCSSMMAVALGLGAALAL